MCRPNDHPLNIQNYSSEVLRNNGSRSTIPPKRDIRKRLYAAGIWSCRSKYITVSPGDELASVSNCQQNVAKGRDVKTVERKTCPLVKLGVMNCRSMDNKSDYIFDHMKDNNLDIVALTETWLSNDDTKSRRVVMNCAEYGYTLHHIPRSSGRRGGGVGVLINNSIKLTSHLEPVNVAESFESMEMIITIVSISVRLVVIYRMPPSKQNKIKRSTFITEFSDYIEKLSCLSCNLMIVGDFNINWLDFNGNERKQLYAVLETFGLVQRISTPTYENGHLLDYIITRESSEFASHFIVSDKISDHMALHASLTCKRPHPVRKKICVRSLKRVNDEALITDLSGIITELDYNCGDVNVVVTQYDAYLTALLDKHAPLKKLHVVERPLNDWMNDDIQALKVIRRSKEAIWRKSPIVINHEIYQESCMVVKNAITSSKTNVIQTKIADTKGDQKQLFKIVATLLGRKRQIVLPEYHDPATLASRFNLFFMDKIDKIRAEFPLLESSLPPYSFESMDSVLPTCTTILDNFSLVTKEELIKIISTMNKTTCASDPFPTKLLMSHLPTIIDVILHIVNLCISTSIFPMSCKSSIVKPLIKKPGLDSEILKNYRPVSNLSFLSKIIEKVISIRILAHITDNDIIDKFQSAYKCGHSTETALLRVYNDIVTTVGKGSGSFLVLLDLSAAFDTIDHNNLFMILSKYVGITGDALLLIKSYFSDRSQQVCIDNIMSDLASIVCGVPQGSVLGPLKFCLYLLPLGAILKHHGIGYHIYADDTQLYISFKCINPSASLPKLNGCISDIRVWMIKNKLKINDSKTEFIVFRSPQVKQDLSGLTVSVGDSLIPQSSKVRDLGVIFDQFLNFDDYISSVCKSTHYHLRNIGRIRSLLTYDATSQLIHALITIRLDYCNSLLYNLPKSSIGRLQKIQNQAARILTKTPHCQKKLSCVINIRKICKYKKIILSKCLHYLGQYC